MLELTYHVRSRSDLVRVIAGSAKGRNLLSVPGTGTRPITDRVKESLFDILGADVQRSLWLDLYAGTGSVGIEALSRGAEHVVFIDKAYPAVATVRRNLDLTGFADRSEVVRGDALRYIAQARGDRLFDYVYVAPPQYQDLWAETLARLDERSLLVPDGEIIVQIHPRELHPVSLRTLEQADERRYGSTLLIFYRLASSQLEGKDDASSG